MIFLSYDEIIMLHDKLISKTVVLNCSHKE